MISYILNCFVTTVTIEHEIVMKSKLDAKELARAKAERNNYNLTTEQIKINDFEHRQKVLKSIK